MHEQRIMSLVYLYHWWTVFIGVLSRSGGPIQPAEILPRRGPDSMQKNGTHSPGPRTTHMEDIISIDNKSGRRTSLRECNDSPWRYILIKSWEEDPKAYEGKWQKNKDISKDPDGKHQDVAQKS